ASGKRLTAGRMVERAVAVVKDWDYQAVSLGFPGLVGADGPRAEPANLAPGWVGFDFAAAFGRPVKILNDAAMQALGSYEGGRMLFLGLGTSLGSTLVSDQVIVPLELGQLSYGGDEVAAVLGNGGLERLGHEGWQHVVGEVVRILRGAFVADYVVLGGGNAKKVSPLPEGVRVGGNRNAFV